MRSCGNRFDIALCRYAHLRGRRRFRVTACAGRLLFDAVALVDPAPVLFPTNASRPGRINQPVPAWQAQPRWPQRTARTERTALTAGFHC